jgi:hypothetical protein
MGYYEITVESHIDKKRERSFEGMEFKYLPEGKTLITGNLLDQAQLFSVLNRIRDMNITLVSIKEDNKDMEVLK